MKVHYAPCPDCSRSFCFPVEFPGNQFRLLCPHCHVGYDLLKVVVSEQSLGRLFSSRRAAPLLLKPWYNERIFRYLTALPQQFCFAGPEQPNAIVFLVSQTRSRFPLAVYFHDTYHRVRPLNRLLFSASLSAVGAVLLLAMGLSLLPVLVGALLAEVYFARFTALPKIKGETRKRLVREQALLKQAYQLQQSLNQVCQDQTNYQNLLTLQQEVFSKPGAAPKHEQTLQCLKDYLGLCDRAIHQYKAAIRSAVIQIETSRLSVELPSQFIDPQIEFGLDCLADQLENHSPSRLAVHDTNNDPTP